jgi:hypothetical protein
MATAYFLGTADLVQKEMRATPANVAVSDVYTLSVGGIEVASFTATTDVEADVTAGLVASWEANKANHPYSANITSSDETTYVKLLADTAGVDFTVTSAVTGTGTCPMSTATANSGPNDLMAAGNWTGGGGTGGMPNTDGSDDVWITDCDVDICWGLVNTVNAWDFNSLHITHTFTGRLGLDRSQFAISANGKSFSSEKKPEYRSTYLTGTFDNTYVGEEFGPPLASGGAPRLKIKNTATGTHVAHIYQGCAQTADSGMPPIRLWLSDNSTPGHVYIHGTGAGVGISVDMPGEASYIESLYMSCPSTTHRIWVGADVTISASFLQTGGQSRITLGGTLATCTVDGGILEVLADGAQSITTFTQNGGTVYDEGFVNLTTANHNGGTLDCTRGQEAITIATYNPEVGAILKGLPTRPSITTFNRPSDTPYTLTVS